VPDIKPDTSTYHFIFFLGGKLKGLKKIFYQDRAMNLVLDNPETKMISPFKEEELCDS
jgi:hypothetical protein